MLNEKDFGSKKYFRKIFTVGLMSAVLSPLLAATAFAGETYNPYPDFFSGSEVEIFATTGSQLKSQIVIRFVGNGPWSLVQYLSGQNDLSCQAADSGAECVFALDASGRAGKNWEDFEQSWETLSSGQRVSGPVSNFYKFHEAGRPRNTFMIPDNFSKVNLLGNLTKVSIEEDISVLGKSKSTTKVITIKGPDTEYLAKWINARSVSKNELVPVGTVSRGGLICNAQMQICRMKISTDGRVADVGTNKESYLVSESSSGRRFDLR